MKNKVWKERPTINQVMLTIDCNPMSGGRNSRRCGYIIYSRDEVNASDTSDTCWNDGGYTFVELTPELWFALKLTCKATYKVDLEEPAVDAQMVAVADFLREWSKSRANL